MYITSIYVYGKYISLMQADDYEENANLWYWKY